MVKLLKEFLKAWGIKNELSEIILDFSPEYCTLKLSLFAHTERFLYNCLKYKDIRHNQTYYIETPIRYLDLSLIHEEDNGN